MKASHDSLTSYPLKNWWLRPILGFGKTQTKTIEDQFKAGVRYFDLRFVYSGGDIYAAHGRFTFNITLHEALARLSILADENETDIYFRILYERTVTDGTFLSFKHRVNSLLAFQSKHLRIHCIGQKKQWAKHTYYENISFVGINNFGLTNFDEKIAEMEEETTLQEPYIFECYSYKIWLPWFSHKLIEEFIPDNSMRNFV